MHGDKIEQWLALGADQVEKKYAAGEDVLRQGERKGQLLVLAKGSVEVIKDGMQICTVTEKGAIFGEISALLKSYQNATVRALESCVFYVIPNAEKFLATHPEAAFQLARMLARRLALLDSHFADLKSKITYIQAESVGRLSDANGAQSGSR